MTITDHLPAELVPGGEPLTEEQLAGVDAALDIEPEGVAALAVLLERAGDDDALVMGAAAQIPVAVARFSVDDDDRAEWAMRKLAAVRAEQHEVTERAGAWMEEIERWQNAQMRRLAGREALFEGWLVAYLRGLREGSKGSIRSRPLPSGTIRSTEYKPKVAIADEAAVIAWAEEDEARAAVVKRPAPSALVSELRKLAKPNAATGQGADPETGEAVPGTTVTAATVEYRVETTRGLG